MIVFLNQKSTLARELPLSFSWIVALDIDLVSNNLLSPRKIAYYRLCPNVKFTTTEGYKVKWHTLQSKYPGMLRNMVITIDFTYYVLQHGAYAYTTVKQLVCELKCCVGLVFVLAIQPCT